jgi:hypothetical protein
MTRGDAVGHRVCAVVFVLLSLVVVLNLIAVALGWQFSIPISLR